MNRNRIIFLLKVMGIGYFTLMGLLLQMNWFCAWLSNSKMCMVYINNFGEAMPEYYITLLLTALSLTGIILALKEIINNDKQ